MTEPIIIVSDIVSPERIPNLVPDDGRLTEMILRAVESGSGVEQ